ncbi:MAG: coenzyme F420 hydrogenase, partial [Halobacteriaceae archaeon]
MGTENGHQPGVPDTDDDTEESVPPVSEGGAHGPEDRTVPEEGADDGCGPGACTCGDHGRAATDGGGVAASANVDEDGSLGDVEFTPPAEGISQDIEYEDPPERRVGVPEGVELDTPSYAIRSEMNDIETPDEKTWFMELDDAVIEEGRC